MKNLSRIKNTSHVLYYLYTVLFFTIPIAAAYYWISFNSADLPLPRAVEGIEIHAAHSLSTGTLISGFLVTLLPSAVLMYRLFQLRKLFRLYKHGNIFTIANTDCLKKLSIALLAWAPARMSFDALSSFILTSGNPEGQRSIAVYLQEGELTALLLGTIFLVIAWVMGEAQRLQEDHAEII